ncbi:hypothetical protein TBLA_0I02670 [Henningerozyma blattae CBS 6284]|uniref:Mitochondrial inner membrane protein COX18 n=1 Tax=Henningerozyma blattae (strain ATCC 34711 / CBS 6284 / DSM 70876 / NBRC 10599 / NRRL Y-10934 / UCD 77-7) TaxID=1071380 RepID=I2H971_HENB6|nr:hypothetical protein TBLA_0I02670 [Tetrapisispora blattae CBS 6284]CCH62923.1 hypothetical protein TBLA_0I02670 [Tetrapisispora blattae CBS 6284]
MFLRSGISRTFVSLNSSVVFKGRYLGRNAGFNNIYTRTSINLQSPRRNYYVFDMVSQGLLALHQATALPWLLLIPGVTIVLRSIVTLPLSVWQRKRIVQQHELRRIVKGITPISKLRLASVASTQANQPPEISSAVPNLLPEQITLLALKETRKKQKKLFKEYHVETWKNFVLPLVQIPLWVSVSMGIRSLVNSGQPITDIYQNDILQSITAITNSTLDLGIPLVGVPMVIPLFLGVLSILNVEYNGRLMIARRKTVGDIPVATRPEQSRLFIAMSSILNVSKLGCIFMMGVSSQAPLILSLYWITSQLFSLIQNIILEKLWKYEV